MDFDKLHEMLCSDGSECPGQYCAEGVAIAQYGDERYDQGLDDGNSEGYESGLDYGSREGYDRGYSDGKSDGLLEARGM